MRKDVKVGMAVALAVVLLAGWYYSRDKGDQQSIPLGETDTREVLATTDQIEDQPSHIESQPVAEHRVETTPVIPVEPPVADDDAVASSDEDYADNTDDDEESFSGLDRSIGFRPPLRDGSLLAAEQADDEPVERGQVTAPDEPADDSPAAVVKAPTEDPKPETAPQTRPAAPVRAQPVARGSSEAGAVETYTVQPGDTFAVLAEVYYGSQQYTRYLMDANPQIENPQQLRAGVTINIPPLTDQAAGSATAADAPATTEGRRVYVVKEGDSFYRIAKQELGKASRWEELLELNKEVVNGNAQGLRPGMVLMLPQTEPRP